jgi:hypothetical protein
MMKAGIKKNAIAVQAHRKKGIHSWDFDGLRDLCLGGKCFVPQAPRYFEQQTVPVLYAEELFEGNSIKKQRPGPETADRGEFRLSVTYWLEKLW